MANTWIMALKHWNSMHGEKYKVPKKGSKEYDEVKAVQDSMVNGSGIIDDIGKIAGRKKNKIRQIQMDIMGEVDDNKKLYKRTKKNVKEANDLFEKTKPLQYQSINNLKRFNSMAGKVGSVGSMLGLGHKGGSLEKAVSLAQNDPEQFVKLVNQQTGQSGSGLKLQQGGFLPAFIVPFIPAITAALSTAAGAFATGAIGAAGAYAVDELVGSGLTQLGGSVEKKQVALLKALEGEKPSKRPNKARDSRIMRKYKKNLKMMSGSGAENLILDNPEEAYEVGKLIFGVPTVPTVKDGKVQIPPTPLENLWNMIF